MPVAVTSETLYSESYRRNPFPVWEILRNDYPVFYDEIDGVWIVTRYDDVASVLREWETYSTQPYAQMFGPVIGKTLVEMDGEEHSIRRRLVAGAFVGDPLKSYLPLIDRVNQALVDDLIGRERIDTFADFATHLPVAILAQILDLPNANQEFSAEWPRQIMDGLWGIEPARSIGAAAHNAMGEYLQPLITERRACPYRDVISQIVSTEIDGIGLSDEEVKTFVSLLINAGSDTTSHALQSVLFNTFREPGLFEAVQRDPELMNRIFTETMRRDTTVTYENRTTTRDVEWYGQELPKGSTIRAYIGAAHTDETVFADPLRFDPHRKDLFFGRERRAGIHNDELAGHMGFGLGRHFCIGYELARAAITSSCLTLLERLESPRIAEDTDPRLVIQFMFRTVDDLVLECGP